MKIHIIFWLATFGTCIFAQSDPANEVWKSKLEAINIRLCRAYVARDLKTAMEFYQKESVCMPEYQPVLNGSDAIRAYYREIFNRRNTQRFDKKILEIIDLKEKIVEIGTFNLDYKNAGNDQLMQLDGKYFNVWAVQQDGALQLMAESYGYFHKVEDSESHVVPVTPHTPAKTAANNNDHLRFELLALNSLMEKGVQTRNGELRAGFFTEDGVFMPHADTTQTGKNAIRKHLIEYSSRGKVTIDTISVYNDYFEPLGNYVLEFSRFYVKWHVPGLSGLSKGKGIRLWRREPDCSLKICREIGLHDE